jgi:hypothetical protein
MSLVEVVVVVALLGLLLGIVLPVVTTLGQASQAVTASFDAADQLQGPTATLTRLLTEAVAPAPPGSGTWWAVFQPGTSDRQLVFTADVGPLGQELQQGNPASAVTGPALVTVSVTPEPTPGGGEQLVASLALPQPGTCPPAGTAEPVASGCQYPGWEEQLFDLPHLQLGSQPLFQFLVPGSDSRGNQLQSTVPSTCTDSSSTMDCPLDQVQAVTFDLQVARNGTPPTAVQSEVWLASPSYDPALG